jgi:hypothetical protein
MDKLREFAEECLLRHLQQLTTCHDNLPMLGRLVPMQSEKIVLGMLARRGPFHATLKLQDIGTSRWQLRDDSASAPSPDK